MKKDIKIALIIIVITIIITSFILIKNFKEKEEKDIDKPYVPDIKDIEFSEKENEDNASGEETKSSGEDICYVECGINKEYCKDFCNNYDFKYSTSSLGIESCYAHAEDHCSVINSNISQKINDEDCCCWNCAA